MSRTPPWNPRIALVGGALTVVAVAASLLSLRAGSPVPYLVGASCVLVGIVLGAKLTRVRDWAGLVLASVLPVLTLPLVGFLDAGPLTYSNASGALAMLACAAAFAVALRSSGRRRAAALGWALLLGAMPLVYEARAATLGVCLVALTAFLSHRLKADRLLRWLPLLLLAAALALPLALGAVYQEGDRSALHERVADATLGPLRQQVWHEALELVAEAPLLGVGPSRFAEVAPSAQLRDDAYWAHNEFLQTAAELGVPIATFMLLAFAAALWPRTGHTSRSRAVVVVALALLGANATLDYVLRDPVVLMAAGLLLGSIDARAHAGAYAAGDGAPLAATLRGHTTLLVALAAWLLLALPLPGLAPDYTHRNGAHLRPEGADFVAPGELRSVEPPMTMYERLSGGAGFTVEGWFAPDNHEQDGPARLVTSSVGIIHRNFTLGQVGTDLEFRLRTSQTDWNARQGRLVADDVFTDTELRHVAVVYDGVSLTAYVDGRLHGSGPAPRGDFSTWVYTYPLILGNEEGGARPWLGRIARVGIYDIALSPDALTRLAGQVDIPQAGAFADEIARGLVGLYDLRGSGDFVQEASGGTALERPDRVRATPPGFLENLLGSDEGADAPLLRSLLLSSLLAACATFVLAASFAREHKQGQGSRTRRALGIGAGTALLMVTALYVRHRTGAEVSVWILLAPFVGAGAAELVLPPPNAPLNEDRPRSPSSARRAETPLRREQTSHRAHDTASEPLLSPTSEGVRPSGSTRRHTG